MAYEDFSTYTEVDPNNRITIGGVGNVRIDHQAIRNEDAHVYDDKGSNHFQNFEHLVDIRSDFNNGDSMGGVWAVSNTVDDMKYWIDNTKRALWLRFYDRTVSGDERIYLDEQTESGGHTFDSYNLAAPNTWYYVVIERDDTTLTCDIYSDSARSVWVDTLTVTCEGVSTAKYQYVFGCNTQNTGAAVLMNNDIENLDLQEGVDTGTGVSIWDGTEVVELARDDTSSVKLWNGSEVVGIKLVATNHADATPIHIWDGTSIKAWKKKV